jgi:hypothetical protein
MFVENTVWSTTTTGWHPSSTPGIPASRTKVQTDTADAAEEADRPWCRELPMLRDKAMFFLLLVEEGSMHQERFGCFRCIGRIRFNL